VDKGRLLSFSDGVIAIILTIMVLELKVPLGASFEALQPVLPVFFCYVLSFVFVSIYWVNHHHHLQVAKAVSGGVLWANLHLLFWLSLIPFVTGWMGENHFASGPVALYGVVMIMAGSGYYILVRAIMAAEGSGSAVAKAVGKDLKGKVSLVFYALAIALSFFLPWAAVSLYVLVAIIWLVPDKRMERVMR
jgi:uncharacterized membrane protein